jgi:aspartate/methionine/tyrosine aminotransferase
MEVMKAAAARERTHGDVLHLEVGQPSTPAPALARKAAIAAVEEQRLGYTDAWGTPRLRGAIADRHATLYGMEIAADRIVATIGASAGFILTMLAAFDVGDRVGITEPGYAAYRNIIRALDLELVGVPVGPETGYRPTPDLLDRHGPLAGFVLASPSNPTGTMVSPAELAALASYCDDNGIVLVSDEIYHGLVHDGIQDTAVRHSDSAIVVQSFSKYYSMTGWRLGWLILPDDFLTPVERLAQNLFISPPSVSQEAAIAALGAIDELEDNVARYRVNRTVLLRGLERAGLAAHAPADGAFYIWLDVSEICDDSQLLSRRWLEDIGVAVTPGIDFDPKLGHRYVRLSYSESTEDITEAVRRIQTWRAAQS